SYSATGLIAERFSPCGRAAQPVRIKAHVPAQIAVRARVGRGSSVMGKCLRFMEASLPAHSLFITYLLSTCSSTQGLLGALGSRGWLDGEENRQHALQPLIGGDRLALAVQPGIAAHEPLIELLDRGIGIQPPQITFDRRLEVAGILQSTGKIG